MKKKFNLSKRRKITETDWGNRNIQVSIEYSHEDVQKFIELIKERIGYRFSGGHSDVLDKCSEEIDKLAGKKFTISKLNREKDE